MGSYVSPWKEVRSLLMSIRNVYRAYEQNIISSLSMAFQKAKCAYCLDPNPLVSSASESRLCSSRTRMLRRLPQRGVDLYWAQTAKYCVVSGAYVPKVVLELERTAYVMDVWTASPPEGGSRLRWSTQWRVRGLECTSEGCRNP